jgi:hypothetical protein
MAEEMEFFKKAKQEEKKSIEMDEDEIDSASLKVPTPVFDKPTECEITEVKFYKSEDKAFDKNKTEYTPFMMSISFKEKDKPISQAFTITYRGGKFYNKKDKDGNDYVSTYIGPLSAMGKLKASCVNSGIDPGLSLTTWKEALRGKIATLQAQKIIYEGKTYDKNVVMSLRK